MIPTVESLRQCHLSEWHKTCSKTPEWELQFYLTEAWKISIVPDFSPAVLLSNNLAPSMIDCLV